MGARGGREARGWRRKMRRRSEVLTLPPSVSLSFTSSSIASLAPSSPSFPSLEPKAQPKIYAMSGGSNKSEVLPFSLLRSHPPHPLLQTFPFSMLSCSLLLVFLLDLSRRHRPRAVLASSDLLYRPPQSSSSSSPSPLPSWTPS